MFSFFVCRFERNAAVAPSDTTNKDRNRAVASEAGANKVASSDADAIELDIAKLAQEILEAKTAQNTVSPDSERQPHQQRQQPLDAPQAPQRVVEPLKVGSDGGIETRSQSQVVPSACRVVEVTFVQVKLGCKLLKDDSGRTSVLTINAASEAEQKGVQIGDKLVAINDVPMESHEMIVQALQTWGRPITLRYVICDDKTIYAMTSSKVYIL